MSTENPQPPLLSNNEIITRTTIQLVLITIYLIIQIIILAKKQTKSFSYDPLKTHICVSI